MTDAAVGEGVSTGKEGKVSPARLRRGRGTLSHGNGGIRSSGGRKKKRESAACKERGERLDTNHGRGEKFPYVP